MSVFMDRKFAPGPREQSKGQSREEWMRKMRETHKRIVGATKKK